MLFILTGDVQTGKTRWLQRLCALLQERGVPVEGVVAPGVWRAIEPDAPIAPASRDAQAGNEHGGAFEKLGIDNVLLPQGEKVPFARRRDLARAEGSYVDASQAARAQLVWHIDDGAIEHVDAHLAALAARADEPAAAPALLVVDELGRLELLAEGGLAAAVRLVARGPVARYAHELVVVREDLVPLALQRLAGPWGPAVEQIGPSEDFFEKVSKLFLT